MEILYRKKFRKVFRKLPKKVQAKFFEKIEIFLTNPFHYSLNNHALNGEFEGVRSFDVTGDIRAHYTEVDGVAIILTIGSHSELYS